MTTGQAIARPPVLLGTARVLAGLAAAVAALALIGWVFDIGFLTRLGLGEAGMKFNTAVCIILLSASHMVRQHRLIIGLSGLVAVVAGLTLLEYAIGHNLGLDELIVKGANGSPHPGRMAVTTALSLLVLAAARTVPVTHATRFVRPAAATAVGGVAGLACLGYLYGVRSLYEIGPFSAVAVHTAACLGALALAELAVVPDGVLTNVIRGSGPGAVLSRRLLPVAVIVLPTLAYLRLRGQQAGWYDTHFGIAILATGSVMVVTSVTLIAARGLDHADEARQKLVLELREVNDSLESQVGERSHRLVEKEAQVAVFADRDRIAADLHDRIIQRIFANGMQLESIAARVNDKALSGRIVSIVDDLDKGIAELRETIFMLKTLSTPTDLDTNVHETAHDASRVLGFNPSVAMTGELTRVPSDAGTHLLAVLRESLSNVARHADASEVDVTLIVDEHVTLIVRDNGRGLPSELAHASGTKNIQVRAETLGGTAQWTANEPQGTEFRWRIPLADPWVL